MSLQEKNVQNFALAWKGVNDMLIKNQGRDRGVTARIKTSEDKKYITEFEVNMGDMKVKTIRTQDLQRGEDARTFEIAYTSEKTRSELHVAVAGLCHPAMGLSENQLLVGVKLNLKGDISGPARLSVSPMHEDGKELWESMAPAQEDIPEWLRMIQNSVRRYFDEFTEQVMHTNDSTRRWKRKGGGGFSLTVGKRKND